MRSSNYYKNLVTLQAWFSYFLENVLRGIFHPYIYSIINLHRYRIYYYLLMSDYKSINCVVFLWNSKKISILSKVVSSKEFMCQFYFPEWLIRILGNIFEQFSLQFHTNSWITVLTCRIGNLARSRRFSSPNDDRQTDSTRGRISVQWRFEKQDHGIN